MRRATTILRSRIFIAAVIAFAGCLAYFLCNMVNSNLHLNVSADSYIPLTSRSEEYFLFLFGLALFALLFLRKDGESSELAKNAVFGLLLCFLVLNFGQAVREVVSNVRNPRQWDFFDFFITGKIAATGGNIYSPELFQSIPLPVPPREDFVNEVLKVGSKYPPNTSLFFALFGFFPFTASLILFALVQLLFLVLSGFEIKKLIDGKENGLLIAFVLLFLIAGTMKSIEYLAPNFIVLYLVLKSAAAKSGTLSGFLLGLAILFRPFFLILFLDFILRKRIKPMIGVAIALASTSALSLVAFGPSTWINYFLNGPFKHVPVLSVYSNYTFISLNALLLRTGLMTPIWGSPLFHPITLVYVGIILAFIVFVLVKRPLSMMDSLGFLIPWALFLYPESWWSYTVFLVFPLINLYRERGRLDARYLMAIGIPVFVLLNDFMPIKPESVVVGLFIFAAANSLRIVLRRKGSALGGSNAGA